MKGFQSLPRTFLGSKNQTNRSNKKNSTPKPHHKPNLFSTVILEGKSSACTVQLSAKLKDMVYLLYVCEGMNWQTQ